MPAQNRRILPPDDEHPFPREARDFIPGPDRDAMRAIIPTGDNNGVVIGWQFNARRQYEMHIGVPGKAQDVRVFPEAKARMEMMKVAPADAIPPNHVIKAWWNPCPSDEDAGEKVCTLHIGLVRDVNAPAQVSGDGLEQKTDAELRTTAGVEGVKGVKKGMLPAEIIERIRDHRKAKLEEAREPVPA